MTKPKTIDEMNYEEAFQGLEEIITLLEAGDRPLEETLEAYKRGQELFKRCSELLEKAELQVRQLTNDKTETEEEEE